MADNYDAIYQAARSRIGHCDSQSAIENAMRDAFGMASHYLASVAQDYAIAAAEAQRPSVLFRPRIAPDGNAWAAVYGDNVQEGIAGFGDSPDEAMREFDKAWYAKMEKRNG